jgi:peptidoglycan L-alanyl-D-glutamate endopeptidase CwlK
MKAAAAEEGVALVWGGDWKTFRDGPHFELSRTRYP